MTREWTDEEAAIQRECWAHGGLLTDEALQAEVAARREAAESTQDGAAT